MNRDAAGHGIITFKADASLRKALSGIPNRSEFIRSAILSALESICPLCHGTGIMTPHQREHWERFATNHPLRECDECHEYHLVCGESRTRKARP